MRIKNISCTQFAGIRGADISLNDGINIIYGKNESGKSTLVNLISRILFQNVKLDGRSNKDFIDLYFPSALKNGGTVGDFIDGRLSFETENGTYILTKEWGEDARCKLSAPNGAIRSQQQIDEVLREALIYGEGVYADMLFPSQRNADASLQTLLDASKKTDAKQEISDAVTMAFAESGGVSVDAIGQAIEAKIREIEGLHWDFEKSAPVKRSGRWARDLGEILKAYYDMEDAKAVLDSISALEAEADRTASEYNERNNAVSRAEKEYDIFGKYAKRLAAENEYREKTERLNTDIKKYSDILNDWPKLAAALDKAKKLYAEKTNRIIFDKYNAAKKLADGINEYQKRLDSTSCPDDDELLRLKSELRTYSSLENKLCGMNITAQLNMLNGHNAVIKSLRTGEVITPDANMTINEAVSITVPDVMEMRLAPADTDAEEIKKQLALSKSMIDEIYNKYRVSGIDEIERKSAEYREAGIKIDSAKNRLAMLLDGTTLDELSEKAGEIVNVREMADIDSDILSLCKNADITRFITQRETQINLYEKEYGSVDTLKNNILVKTSELDKLQKEVKETDDIPEKYRSIKNPDEYLEELQDEVRNARELRENALSAKAAALGRLETYREGLDNDPAENVREAERRFNEEKELLKHWKHIAQVFEKKRGELSDNPMQDIAERFTHYLNQISGGKVSSEFTEQDKLGMNIYSSDRLIDYGKLSEGTKETVFFAFRLAVLDHLFPSGGGVIILDDPFTDMDTDRTKQSCELLKDIAKRHQVIFLTCKDEYTAMLNGSEIRI